MEDLTQRPTNREFLIQAMIKLSPGKNWIVSGETYEEILWLEKDFTKPSEIDVQTEFNNIVSYWETNNYKLHRQFAYPSIKDQLDMLYHLGYEGWKSEINKIKEEYPKN